MPFDTQVLVVEMGMRGLGQIEELSVSAEPNISVITNIGSAHIELLGSVENIRKAKLEIVCGMISRRDLAPLLCADTKLYAELVAQPSLLQTHVEPKGKDWKLNVMAFDDSRHYALNGLAGAAIHSDANAVAAVARVLGLAEAEIQTGLSKYNPGRGRGSYHHDTAGNLIIDDSYNANPDSLRASVDAVCEQYGAQRRILVLGELMESSAELVAEVVDYVRSRVIVIDARGREISEVVADLRKRLDGKSVVLVKGSRASKLEKVVEELIP
jgi:UDP-N-acetylmuramoyl-tripeptide--D-alanyl-D-alanine ligase